jgi:hypothetical protein
MKIGWWTALSAMALTACAHFGGASKEPSPAQQAQDQAVQALEHAAQAQHNATEEQQKAEELQRQVTQKQRELAEAQANALAQVAKAEQTQREAQRLEQQTHPQILQAQQQALRLQRTEALTLRNIHQESLKRWTQTQQVSGTAVDASDEVVRLRSRNRGDIRLKLSPETAVTVDGKQSSASNIQPGSDVRASYQVIDGQATAVTLDAKSKYKAKLPKQQNKPGEQNQQGDQEQQEQK